MTTRAFLRGVVAPVVLVVLAYIVLIYGGEHRWYGDQLFPLPLSLAAVWVMAPVTGGLLLHDATPVPRATAAVVLGLLMGLAVTWLFVFAAGTGTECPADGLASPALYILGCVGVGALAGVGASGSLVATASLVRRAGWWVAVPAGIVVNVAGGAAGLWVFYNLVRCWRF